MREALRYAILWAVLFGLPFTLRACAVYHACKDGLCR